MRVFVFPCLLLCSGASAKSLTLPEMERLPAFELAAGQTFSVVIKAHDADGDAPALFIRNPPFNSSFAALGEGRMEFRWTPAKSDIGVHRLAVIAEDARDRALKVERLLELVVAESPPEVKTKQGSNDSLARQAATNEAESTIQVEAKTEQLAESVAQSPDMADPADAEPSAGSTSSLAAEAVNAEPSEEGQLQKVSLKSPPEPDSAPIAPLLPFDELQVKAGEWVSFMVEPGFSDDEAMGVQVDWLPVGARLVERAPGVRQFLWHTKDNDVGKYSLKFVAFNLRKASERLQHVLELAVEPREAVADGNANHTEAVGLLASRDTAHPEPVIFETINRQYGTVGSPIAQLVRLRGQFPTELSSDISLLNPPDGAMLVGNDETSAVLHWTPGEDQVGRYILHFEATDPRQPAQHARMSWNLEIIEQGDNLPPTIQGPGFMKGKVNELVEFTVYAEDPDSPSPDARPRILARNAPRGARLKQSGNGGWKFSWFPEPTDLGVHTIELVAHDVENPQLESVVLIRVEVGQGSS